MAFLVLLRIIGLDFAIQWIFWSISAYFHTEWFFDLVGSSTFIFLLTFCYRNYSRRYLRPVVQVIFIITWATRLGFFLFNRVLTNTKNRRTSRTKDDPKLQFIYWTVQGVWIFVTLLPTLIMLTQRRQPSLNAQDGIGWTLWFIGFVFEALADHQKFQFRSIPANQDKFISTGLWSISRHPNYFGEILLWFGLFISASSAFTRWYHYLSILSPTFVYLMITRKTGIPLLERYGKRKWGHLGHYQGYIRRVPVLVPSLFRR